MASPPKPGNPAAQNDGCGVLGVIGAIVLLVYAVTQCSSEDGQIPPADNMIDANMTSAIAKQAPTEPEPLNRSSISEGARNFAAVLSAAEYPGAMIFSQNCYDALGRQFSWSRADLCGAFDALATRSVLSEGADIEISEEGYFQSEASAGRYLAAVTGAGQAPEAADVRLAELQSQVSRMRLPTVREPVQAVEPVNEAAAADEGEGEAEPMDAALDNVLGE